MNIFAYHGTSEERAYIILATGFKINTHKTKLPGDLGRGIYTFIDREVANPEAKDKALNYVTNIKNRYKSPKVLKLTCDVKEDEVLNFNDAVNAQRFQRFREENNHDIQTEMRKLDRNGSYNRGNIDGLVIELMLAKYEISPSVIIKDTYTWLKNENGDYKRSNFPNAREMCIRSLEIIKSKCIT